MARRSAVLLLVFSASLTLAGCLASGTSAGPGEGWCEDVPGRLVSILLDEPVTHVAGSSSGCEYSGSSEGRAAVVTLYPDRGAETLAAVKAAGSTVALNGIGDQAVLATAECQRACVLVETTTLWVLQGDSLVSVSWPGLADRAEVTGAAQEIAELALQQIADTGSAMSPAAQ